MRTTVWKLSMDAYFGPWNSWFGFCLCMLRRDSLFLINSILFLYFIIYIYIVYIIEIILYTCGIYWWNKIVDWNILKNRIQTAGINESGHNKDIKIRTKTQQISAFCKNLDAWDFKVIWVIGSKYTLNIYSILYICSLTNIEYVNKDS